jgi:Flp pilus assembly secretin CpaC
VLNVPAPPLVATDPNPSNGDEPPSVAPTSEPPVASTESKTPPAASPAASPQDSPPSVVASPAPPGAGVAPLPDLPGAPRLRMETREAQLVRTEFDVTRAQSLDPRVCDVIQFAPRELTIVGKQQGITRVDFWQEGQEGKRQSYVVCVGTDESAQLRTQDQFAKLREVLRELYPASGVQLESQNGSLVVTGSARSKAEAIAIISLVRRMHTVPVVDNLEVRPE